MAFSILILGASYGSLLGTKCLMAGHDVTLVCRPDTAGLIKREGTVVRLKLKGEEEHRAIRSGDLPGRVDARPPEEVESSAYDLVVLAMQEPQYAAHAIRTLLIRVAAAGVPCLSLMNMPPLPFLKRFDDIDATGLEPAYTNARVWDRFVPGLMSHCSPDPQAFRPPEEGANVLHVGLPTNFKAARFADEVRTAILHRLAADIDAVRLDGKDVPVKLRVHDTVFAPLAKWSMLMAGNYRCILRGSNRPIRDAVHADLERSRAIYEHVDAILRRLGASEDDLVPFEKYARAAESLQKPSSVARAIAAGMPLIERVDRLVQSIGDGFGMPNAEIDEIVATVDDELRANQSSAA